jgi:hypothetical protein
MRYWSGALLKGCGLQFYAANQLGYTVAGSVNILFFREVPSVVTGIKILGGRIEDGTIVRLPAKSAWLKTSTLDTREEFEQIETEAPDELVLSRPYLIRDMSTWINGFKSLLNGFALVYSHDQGADAAFQIPSVDDPNLRIDTVDCTTDLVQTVLEFALSQ